MFKSMTIFSVIVCIMAVSSPITAESLWKPQETKSQLADKKAAKVGDIVTVVIVESSTSSQKASTDTKKDSSVEAGPGVGPLLDRVPLFSYGGGDSMSASGSTSRSSNFTAKMTATITKVNENGTMELEGTRFVQTNKEKEEIKLSGTIRPQDIATDNSILSTYVADAKITHVGSGPIGSRQKEGLIGKIFKILF